VAKNSFKKLDLFELAVARIKNSSTRVTAKVGDLIEVIAPFIPTENYVGVITDINDTHIFVYHGNIKRTIMWNRYVKCTIASV